MKKTENLQLNIIEGTDVPNHAVFNENFNKLDSFSKDVSDNETSLGNAMNSFTNEINDKMSAFINSVNGRITEFETDVDEQLSKISEIEIEIDGVTKKGILKNIVVKDTPDYSTNNVYLPSVDTTNNVIENVSEKRVAVRNYTGRGDINMTSLLGIENANDIVLLSVQLYSDANVPFTSGNVNTLPMDAYSLQKLPYPNANNDIYLSYSGSRTIFIPQTYQGDYTGGWQPSVTPSVPISDVYVSITYIDFE